MPSRIVREGILTSERVNALSPNAELFYRRLMSVVDDYGRFSANLTLLRASCYPLKLDCVKEDSISKHLAECVGARLIVLFTVADKTYLEMQDFRQQVRAKESKYPSPDEGMRSTCVADAKQVQSNVHLDGGGDGDVIEEANASLSAGKPANPPCPQKAIVAAYHEVLPELRQVREWSDSRQRMLAKRWSESRERQSLGWWREFFGYVRQSDWLMGRIEGRGGRPFDCDLEWLIRPTNFVKVVEGKYEGRSA